MSFQGYLRNIEAKTGMSPDDFRRLAAKKGLARGGRLAEGVRPGDVVHWLKSDFELGHGHAMAIVALLKGRRPEEETD